MAISDTTIIVSPRERYTPILESLRSLFNTIPDHVPVIVVQGNTPDHIQQEIEAIRTARHFELVNLPYMVTPNEARNIGAKLSTTEYIIFTDNDIAYEANWLDSIVNHANKHGSDVAAPLILIGPAEKPTIHHAGGMLQYRNINQEDKLFQTHRFNDQYLDEVRDKLSDESLIEHEVSEFHCMLMRKSFYNRIDGLDERLITREQMDLALRVKSLKAKMTFDHESIITYMGLSKFNRTDIDYHFFRWADELARQSIVAFESTWNIKLDENHVRHRFVKRHRERAAVSMHPMLRRILGERLFRKMIISPIEKRVQEQYIRPRNDKVLHIPMYPDIPDIVRIIN